jgi:hypothetical protein
MDTHKRKMEIPVNKYHSTSKIDLILEFESLSPGRVAVMENAFSKQFD